jgi:hypothetical protein
MATGEEFGEIWKQIKGFENYEISSKGNVRNIKTQKILKSHERSSYLRVQLCRNKSLSIHRLVGEAFIPNPENKAQINHKDKNRMNNNVENLEWNTALENNIHRSANCIQINNQNIKVWRIDKITNKKLELYNSFMIAANWCYNNKLCNSIITASKCINKATKGSNKTSYGFKWKIVEPIYIEGEIWKNVFINNISFDKYFVSNLARFKNSKGIIMENYKIPKSGYISITIQKNKYFLHRLVASTFIQNIDNKPAVNHIDGCKTNNNVNNLEWVTIQENNQHNYNIGLLKAFTRPIIQYDLDNNEINRFNSIKEASDKLNIKTIKNVLSKNQKTAGGFIFKYAEEL